MNQASLPLITQRYARTVQALILAPCLLLGVTGLNITPLTLAPAVAQTQAEPNQTQAEPNQTPAKAAFNRLRAGLILAKQSRYQPALTACQQGLQLAEQLQPGSTDRVMLESLGFLCLGRIYSDLGNYSQALTALQNSLKLVHLTSMRSSEGVVLNLMGLVYDNLGRLPEALDAYNQALKIRREVKDRRGEGVTLNNIALVYITLGQAPKALELLDQSLAIRREVKDRLGEGSTLNNIATAYENLSQYDKALDFLQQSLVIRQEVNDRKGEGVTLSNIGRLYERLGQYDNAIAFLNQALTIQRAIRAQDDEGLSLHGLAEVYQSQGQYAKALQASQQALSIFRTSGNRERETGALQQIADLHQLLGQPAKALEFYLQALAIAQKTGHRKGEAISLSSAASLYAKQREFTKANEFFQQALAIRKEIGDRKGTATTLDKIGILASKKPEQALKFFQQALAIRREIGDVVGELYSLNNIGLMYNRLNRATEGMPLLQVALSIAKKFNDPRGQAVTLGNLGVAFREQNQPELAIIMLKQSVNLTEGIRRDLKGLPQEQQESYTQSVADAYRLLAKLLIEQGRLPEAQAVLELLKLQELREFTRDVGIASPGISLAKVEAEALQEILHRFTTLGNFTQEITACEQTKCAQLKQLEQQRDALYSAVNGELKQQRSILAKHFSTEGSTLTPEKLNAEARRIVNAQPGTVLIYPLVLKDKLQFLLALKSGEGAVTFRPFETQVTAEQLYKTIQTFRTQLSEATPAGVPITDHATVKATSQQLYNWLIKPLEPELNHANIKHLVFAPDSTTRYIPLAALFDGQRYLIERYSITTITAASQTDTQETVPQPTSNQPLLLAMGASKFQGLPSLDNVPTELDLIVKTNSAQDTQGVYPGHEFLNTAFAYETLKQNLKGHRILHLATHGMFRPGRPEDSYLVSGRGDKLTTALIDQLGNYGLGNVHLVVLSACETAVGDRDSDGIEIPGISYFFLKNEVKSVLASLWSVNDASTSLLMQQFYQNLRSQTKAEALRQAQQALLSGQVTANGATVRSEIEVSSATRTRATDASPEFSHPYYWAPFILIGNGR